MLGAGAIGCYTGGWLANAGFKTALIGRPGILKDIQENGLCVSNVRGASAQINNVHSLTGMSQKPSEAPSTLLLSESTDLLSACRFILVCVKSAQTEEIAQSIKECAKDDAIIISLQNGLEASRILKRTLPEHSVLSGMVAYNVVNQGEGRFRQSTSGPLMIQDPGGRVSEELASSFSSAGLDLQMKKDMENVQWSKLLLNLNNGINALAGIPIREMLSQRSYRRIIAACMKEALTLYKKAGIKTVRLGKIIPGIAPAVLSLPDFLFFRVASTMINIDPTAMTSLAQDLISGKPTEIDYINGEILRLATTLNTTAPINEGIVSLMHEAEKQGAGSPGLEARQLLRALGLSEKG